MDEPSLSPVIPPPPPPGRHDVLTALAAIVERAHTGDAIAADRAVVALLASIRSAWWSWPRLLDLRAGFRRDSLDDLLADLTRAEPPLNWMHGLLGLPEQPHHVAARVVLSGASFLQPLLLAEAAVRANHASPTDEDNGRLRVLANYAWKRRREEAGYGPTAASLDADDGEESARDR